MPLMGDLFGLAGWRSEGWAYTPDEAIEQFRANYLGADNTIRFQDVPDLSHVAQWVFGQYRHPVFSLLVVNKAVVPLDGKHIVHL